MTDRETPRLLDARVFNATPCPFCASSDLGFYEYVYARHFTVMCKACGGQGPRRISPDEALQVWNRRASEGGSAASKDG